MGRSDEDVRSMLMSGGITPKAVRQELKVAAPMNDLQLLGIMAAIIAAGRQEWSAEECVKAAVATLGYVAGAVRSGDVIAAVRGQPEEVPPE